MMKVIRFICILFTIIIVSSWCEYSCQLDAIVAHLIAMFYIISMAVVYGLAKHWYKQFGKDDEK